MAKRKKKTTIGPVEFDDKKWKEEQDAQTLAEAKAIMKDKSRKAGAKAGAKRIVEKENERLIGLKAVARTKVK